MTLPPGKRLRGASEMQRSPTCRQHARKRNRPQARTRPSAPTSFPSTPRAERPAAARATGYASKRRRGWAAEQGFDGIGTTLSVSPYQYTQVIEQEVRRAAEREGIEGVFEDFRPYYDEATRRSRALGMYRQNYCGCRISDEEATAERAERKAQRAAAKQAERAEHAAEIAAAEAELKKHRAARAAYDKKQARKRAILKSLRRARPKQKASE